jgi:thymidylate synthase
METTIIEGRTGQEVYPRVVKHVLTRGRLRAPRGQTTLDAGTTIVNVTFPTNALPLGCGRDLNRNIAVAEAAQLIGGFSQPELLLRAAPQFERYTDGGKFHGAYGDRIGTQMLDVTRKLRADVNTRQAVVTLWDPWRDNLPDRRDYPCTTMLQFDVDAFDGRLNMTTVMRSNDVWLGLPYDMFQFTQLQLSLAWALDIEPGRYRHIALSMHLYSENVIAAENKIYAPTDFTMQPTGFGRPGMAFSEIMTRAKNVTTNQPNENETTSEAWYRERFTSYMGQDVDERRDGGSGAISL